MAVHLSRHPRDQERLDSIAVQSEAQLGIVRKHLAVLQWRAAEEEQARAARDAALADAVVMSAGGETAIRQMERAACAFHRQVARARRLQTDDDDEGEESEGQSGLESQNEAGGSSGGDGGSGGAWHRAADDLAFLAHRFASMLQSIRAAGGISAGARAVEGTSGAAAAAAAAWERRQKQQRQQQQRDASSFAASFAAVEQEQRGARKQTRRATAASVIEVLESLESEAALFCSIAADDHVPSNEHEDAAVSSGDAGENVTRLLAALMDMHASASADFANPPAQADTDGAQSEALMIMFRVEKACFEVLVAFKGMLEADGAQDQATIVVQAARDLRRAAGSTMKVFRRLTSSASGGRFNNFMQRLARSEMASLRAKQRGLHEMLFGLLRPADAPAADIASAATSGLTLARAAISSAEHAQSWCCAMSDDRSASGEAEAAVAALSAFYHGCQALAAQVHGAMTAVGVPQGLLATARHFPAQEIDAAAQMRFIFARVGGCPTMQVRHVSTRNEDVLIDINDAAFHQQSSRQKNGKLQGSVSSTLQQRGCPRLYHRKLAILHTALVRRVPASLRRPAAKLRRLAAKHCPRLTEAMKPGLDLFQRAVGANSMAAASRITAAAAPTARVEKQAVTEGSIHATVAARDARATRLAIREAFAARSFGSESRGMKEGPSRDLPAAWDELGSSRKQGSSSSSSSQGVLVGECGTLLPCLARLHQPGMREVLQEFEANMPPMGFRYRGAPRKSKAGSHGAGGAAAECENDLRFVVGFGGFVATDVFAAICSCAAMVRTREIRILLADTQLVPADLNGRAHAHSLRLSTRLRDVEKRFCFGLLVQNVSVKSLNLQGCGLDQMLTHMLCEAVSGMRHLTQLNVSGCFKPSESQSARQKLAEAILPSRVIAMTFENWKMELSGNVKALYKPLFPADLQVLGSLCANGADVEDVTLPRILGSGSGGGSSSSSSGGGSSISVGGGGNLRTRHHSSCVVPIRQLLHCRAVALGAEGAPTVLSLVRYLLPHSSCENLDMHGCDLAATPVDELGALAVALGRSRLEVLDLRGSGLGAAHAHCFAESFLTSVSPTISAALHICGIDAGALRPTGGILKSLHLAGCRLGDFELCFISRMLASASCLTELDLSRNVIGSDGMLALAAALPTSRIEVLDISKQQQQQPDDLFQLSTSPLIEISRGIVSRVKADVSGRGCAHPLRNVTVHNCRLTVADFASTASDTTIRGTGMSDCDVHIIADMLFEPACCARVTSIDLSNNKMITTAGAHTVADALVSRRSKGAGSSDFGLDLSFTGIGGMEVSEALAGTMLEVPELRELDVRGTSCEARCFTSALASGCTATSACVATLSGIPVEDILLRSGRGGAPPLELELQGCRLGPAEAEILSWCLAKRKSRGHAHPPAVDLSSNPLLDPVPLLPSIVAGGLTRLDLRSTGWASASELILRAGRLMKSGGKGKGETGASDDFLTSACGFEARMLSRDGIVAVEVAGTLSKQLGDAGAELLAHFLVGAPRLRHLRIPGNGISGRGICLLLDALVAASATSAAKAKAKATAKASIAATSSSAMVIVSARVEEEDPMPPLCLASLDFGGNPIAHGSVLRLARLLETAALCRLERLDLSGCGLGGGGGGGGDDDGEGQKQSEGVQSVSVLFDALFGTIDPLHRLRELRLARNGLQLGDWLRKAFRRPGASGALPLAGRETSLRLLELSGNPLGTAGMLRALALLLPGSKMKTLLCAHVAAADEEGIVYDGELVDSFCTSLPFCNLKKLDLGGAMDARSDVARQLQSTCDMHYVQLTI